MCGTREKMDSPMETQLAGNLIAYGVKLKIVDGIGSVLMICLE